MALVVRLVYVGRREKEIHEMKVGEHRESHLKWRERNDLFPCVHTYSRG